jgi:hypothetical protein
MIAEKNQLIMMDPNRMNSLAREFWEMQRMVIMQRRRQELSGGDEVTPGDAHDGGDLA